MFFFSLTTDTKALPIEDIEQDWNTGEKEVWDRDIWLLSAVCSKEEKNKDYVARVLKSGHNQIRGLSFILELCPSYFPCVNQYTSFFKLQE